MSTHIIHGVDMVSRKLLKTEIDKVKNEYLELLYAIIRLLENGASKDIALGAESHTVESDTHLDWHNFVASTYGCLADAPISRGDQGRYESREAME
jgi:hypothetical protein